MIQNYLDALLQDASSELLLAEQEPAAPAPVATDVPEAAATMAQTVVPEPFVECRRRPEVKPRVESAPTLINTPVPHTQAQAARREQPFEALLFDVAGLTLAVPLVSLGTIHALDAEITPLFGQPDWFLGILPTVSGNLKILDTARWVMPERYTDALQEGLRFVISVEGYDWGLAVHGVSRSIKLTPDQVKWRSQQGKRPWLAGTVIDQMCALLDVSALAGLIAADQGQQQRTGRALV